MHRSELLISSLFLAPVNALRMFLGSIFGDKTSVLREKAGCRGGSLSAPAGEQTLNCRVRLAEDENIDQQTDVFVIEISGSIHLPGQLNKTNLSVLITDITGPISTGRPVHSAVKRWRTKGSQVFCYKTDLGRLSGGVTTLSDWMKVAQIKESWLLFPHKGKRQLQFDISLSSGQNDKEFAGLGYSLTYENNRLGYIDLHENSRRAKTLAVRIAFWVSAADNGIFKSEMAVIEKWVIEHIEGAWANRKERRNLKKSLKQTLAFFRSGNQIDVQKICKEIVEISSVADRYDILGLWMRVTGTKGIVTEKELYLLKELSARLEIEESEFLNMLEKILPVGMHEVKDMELVLGIDASTSKEQKCQHLNAQYRKWNSRVTNSDCRIRTQAGDMLELIGEARNKYTG